MSTSTGLLDQVFSLQRLQLPSKIPLRKVPSSRSSKPQTVPPLLHRDQVSSIYTEPFIITGYRQPGTTVLGSIKYAFVLHNDVGNFWTHFLPFVAWVVWLDYLASYEIDFTDPYYYPLLCFWLGSCCYVLFSSMAHLFSNISSTVKSTLFILDYFGIAMYALGGAIGGFFYEQSTDSPLFKYQSFMLTLDVSVALGATLFSGLTRFYWQKYRVLIRALAFVLPYILAVTPFTQRLFVCMLTGNQCVQETLLLHLSGYIFTFMIAFLFVSKLPERFAPGKFDYFFQSHQLFHVTAAIQTCIQMYMFPIDAQLRRTVLTNVEGATATTFNTLLPFFFGLLGGLLVVGTMAVLMIRGVLVFTGKTKHGKKNN